MWWNGRHACLRCMWRELWGFKSPRRQLKTMRLNASVVFNKRMVRTRTLFRVQRPVSRVRRTFAKRTKFFEAKSVDTFNANRSRQVPPIDTIINHFGGCFLCSIQYMGLGHLVQYLCILLWHFWHCALDYCLNMLTNIIQDLQI